MLADQLVARATVVGDLATVGIALARMPAVCGIRGLSARSSWNGKKFKSTRKYTFLSLESEVSILSHIIYIKLYFLILKIAFLDKSPRFLEGTCIFKWSIIGTTVRGTLSNLVE